MQTYVDLDKWVPEKLTMRINGEVYPVRDITMEMFLEILELCELGIGSEPNLVKFLEQVKKVAKKGLIVSLYGKLKRFLRRGKPISDDAGKRKLARFIKKVVPSLPMAILRSMSQAQIQGLLEFLIKSYYEGQTDPNFLKPMSEI